MIIFHVSTGLEAGGAERTLTNLVLGDTSNTHIVVSLTGLGSNGRHLRRVGIETIALDLPKSLPALFSGIRALRKLIKTYRPDIVQTWMYHADLIGGLAARLAGSTAIAWNIRASAPRQAAGGPFSTILRICLAALSWSVPRKIVICSETAREEHIRFGYRKSSFRLIPNGFDPARWNPVASDAKDLRREIRVGPDSRLVGLVARFHPQKNHLQFLTSARDLLEGGHNIHIVLVGAGATLENPEFLNLIQQTGFPTERLSALGEQTNVRMVLSAIDLLVLPSAYGEGFPNVLAESMLCETPCVASDSGDSAHIIGNTGWIYNRNKPELLTDALSRALAEPVANLAKRGEEARARIVDTFPLHEMIGQYVDHFTTLHEDSKAPKSVGSPGATFSCR